jgi:hypothetical protein
VTIEDESTQRWEKELEEVRCKKQAFEEAQKNGNGTSPRRHEVAISDLEHKITMLEDILRMLKAK